MLRKLGTVEDFEGDEAAGAAVLDARQQLLLASCTSETEVVSRLTPALWRLRVAGDDSDDPCRPVLVNGENFNWLDDPVASLPPNMRLKPDLFTAPLVCVEAHAGAGSQGSGDCYLFGRLADRRLQLDGCVHELFEAKMGPLTDAHFGELVTYQRLIPGECRGMLFNGTHFWLFASLHGQAMRLVKGAWAALGSASRVRRFFDDEAPPPPPLVPLLRQLLAALRLRPAPMGGSAYLGGGGSGRVFAVARVREDVAAQPRMALKVVVSAAGGWWASSLTREFQAMQHAAAQGAPVVAVVAGSLQLLDGVGGGFLLARCGVPFGAPASRAACAAAFTSLAALHACDVLHGDARLPNLLRLDGAAAWVDLSANAVARAEFPQAFAVNSRVDAATLAQSVLLAAGDQASTLPAAVTAAVAAYDDASPARVCALADAVWAAANGCGVADATPPEAP